MVQDIIVIVFCVVAFGTAVWGWWIDSGIGKKGNKNDNEKDSENETVNKININEGQNS